MAKYMLESLEDGSHGIIPDEGINYFVGQNRITVHKDGKKIIDKEIDINPDGTISKYNLICDDDKEPELEPVKDVEEFNVANMLPQVYPEGSVLRKEDEKNTEDGEIMIESAADIALIAGFVGIMGLGVAAVIKDHKLTKDAINWYADQHNVEPKFSELKKKTYKVKFDAKNHEFKLTDKEKKLWDYLDQYNAADIYFYNDKRAFGIIYGCHERDIEFGYNVTTYKIRIRTVIYDPKFKEHIEYYAAKAMEKHGLSSTNINDWIVGIRNDYKDWKKDQKKAMKESEDLSLETLSNDLDTILENCNNILERISPYNDMEESTNETSEEVITESVIAESTNTVFDKASWHIDKGMNKKAVVNHFVFMFKWLKKNNMLSKDGLEVYASGIDESVSISSRDLTEDGNRFMTDYYDKYISKVQYGRESDSILDDFLHEFNSVAKKESAEIEESAKPIDAVKSVTKKFDKIAKSELNKISKLAEEKRDLLKELKKETDKLKKNDIKKKLIKNQKDFRKLIKDLSPDNKKKVNKFYSGINHSNLNQVHINNFMDQMRRDNETALRAHQQAMDMHNQANMMHQQAMQNHMMMTGMM